MSTESCKYRVQSGCNVTLIQVDSTNIQVAIVIIEKGQKIMFWTFMIISLHLCRFFSFYFPVKTPHFYGSLALMSRPGRHKPWLKRASRVIDFASMTK